MKREKYLNLIKTFSKQLVKIQQPIRILDSIKWSDDIKNKFFKHKAKELPEISRVYYEKNPLKYNAKEKQAEFQELIEHIHRFLDKNDLIGQLMKKMCQEYIMVVDMLDKRGSKQFSTLSKKLYGSAHDKFYVSEPSLKELSDIVSQTIVFVKQHIYNDLDKKKYSTQQAVEYLQSNLDQYFHKKDRIKILISDDIVADAAAGSEYIKVRKHARFSMRDMRVLEVHEGWVHVGTTINGKLQPYCTFLSKGSPSSTITQEGLAVLMELFSFVSHPDRMMGLSGRIQAVAMAEDGADFLDVYRYFLNQNLDEENSYFRTMRIFRGSVPTGGPFTKDLVYNKGFILIYNFMRKAIQKGEIDKIPLLFVGKLSIDDIDIIANLVEDKIIIPPKYLPPQFKDMAGLSSWMCYSLFLNKINLNKIPS